MKNIKLKYFAVALMMVLQWSCAKDEIPQASEQISKTDLFSEGSMLNDYKNFKIDGVVTNDTKKIEEIAINAHAVVYNPEIKEVDFYSTEASYRRLNPETEHDEKETESVQATAATTFPDNFTDIGGFGANAAGVTGLGNILDQGYFRNYANNVLFAIKFVEGFGTANAYVRLADNTDLAAKKATAAIATTQGTVISSTYQMRGVLSSLNQGTNVTGFLHNERKNNKMLVEFFQNTNYDYKGKYTSILLGKEAYTKLSKGFLSTLGGVCNSYRAIIFIDPLK